MNFDALKNEPRLLAEVSLRPLQGTRFQPTGFPSLGAAAYTLADGTEMLLVESAQSMANHLERWCWNEEACEPVDELKGMPYVESTLPDGSRTNSLLEAHRLNSPYIVNSPEFGEIAKAIGFKKNQPFDRQKLVTALFRYDPNSLIHGVFLEKLGGLVRLPRVLSAFIEATNARVAASGGVKFDRVQPGADENVTSYGKAKDGYGNVPFPRDEYTGDIKAFFNVDLSLIAGFHLADESKRFLLALALLKIQRFLRYGLRLRTACDLDATGINVTRPKSGWALPDLDELASEARDLIGKNARHFPEQRKTPVAYDVKLAKARQKEQEKAEAKRGEPEAAEVDGES